MIVIDVVYTCLSLGTLFISYSVSLFVFFFFNQNTAYEVRISDWSSDVCSSDLVAVAIAQADDLLAIAEHLGGERRGDDRDVRQAAQFRLQNRVGAKLTIELDQRHMRDQPRKVDRRLGARIAAADHRDALALEQGTVAVRAIDRKSVV